MPTLDNVDNLADKLSALHTTATTVRGPRCSVCAMLEELPTAAAEALNAAIANARIPSRTISDTLAADGYYLSPRMLAYHRRRQCSGYR